MLNQNSRIGTVLAIALGVAFLSGCGATQSGPAKTREMTGNAKPANDGWWCVEHGMPEGICAQCSTQLAADFQKKGDWCKEHNRPESQCFICHPDLEAKFAAQYEAKYGKKPPKPEGSEDKS